MLLSMRRKTAMSQHVKGVLLDQCQDRLQGLLLFEHLRQHRSQHTSQARVHGIVQFHGQVRAVTPRLVCSQCSETQEGMVGNHEEGAALAAPSLVSVRYQRAGPRQVSLVLVEIVPYTMVRLPNLEPSPKFGKDCSFSIRVWSVQAKQDMPDIVVCEKPAPILEVDGFEVS